MYMQYLQAGIKQDEPDRADEVAYTRQGTPRLVADIKTPQDPGFNFLPMSVHLKLDGTVRRTIWTAEELNKETNDIMISWAGYGG